MRRRDFLALSVLPLAARSQSKDDSAGSAAIADFERQLPKLMEEAKVQELPSRSSPMADCCGAEDSALRTRRRRSLSVPARRLKRRP
jgi:hypothetical protein